MNCAVASYRYSLVICAGPGRGEAQKHSRAFYRVKVRFSANEHAKMYRKEENDRKRQKNVFVKNCVFVGF
jgi:hypothetical protein